MKETRAVQRFISWVRADIASGLNTDLWLLMFASLIVTLFGVFGIASISVLASTILLMLTLLALSQVRSRQDLGFIRNASYQSKSSVLQDSFPEEYYSARRLATTSFFFAGLSMSRTLPTATKDIERILDNNGQVRILLPNPDNEALIKMISLTGGGSEERIRDRILHSIGGCAEIGDKSTGLAVRVVDFLPRLGINAVDLSQPSGLIMIQLYQFEPVVESSPIAAFTRKSGGPWFAHFESELERMWDAGTDWMEERTLPAA